MTMSAFSSGSSNTATFAANGKQMNLAEYQQYLADQTSPEKIRATAQCPMPHAPFPIPFNHPQPIS